jgi:hypothetical protein
VISTLLFVYLVKGLKLVAYVILVLAHEWPRIATELRHRCVRLGYWFLAIMAALEIWR